MKLNCCKNKKSEIEISEIVDFLKIISEKNRLRILCILQKKERCVCEIWEYLDLPQNLASYHLKALKDFGLIGSRKEGTKIIYFLNEKNIKKLNFLKKFLTRKNIY